MNANLLPKTPVIKDWLKSATEQLKEAGIESAKLDAEVILAHTIRKSRTYLHAHGEQPLEARQYEIVNARLDLRIDRTPVAYIIGHKEFYGRLFRVSPATLIPRPESETVITLLKELIPSNLSLIDTPAKRLVDVGTGSGCIGLTAKLEFPELDVDLLDISRHALTVASRNAKELQATVTVTQSDLLSSYPLKADFIVANLPYVDIEWERSPETDHEPELALFASNEGLHLILKLIEQSPSRLTSGGYILLEADPRQHKSIIEAAKTSNLRHLKTDDFIVVLQKV